MRARLRHESRERNEKRASMLVAQHLLRHAHCASASEPGCRPRQSAATLFRQNSEDIHSPTLKPPLKAPKNRKNTDMRFRASLWFEGKIQAMDGQFPRGGTKLPW